LLRGLWTLDTHPILDVEACLWAGHRAFVINLPRVDGSRSASRPKARQAMKNASAFIQIQRVRRRRILYRLRLPPGPICNGRTKAEDFALATGSARISRRSDGLLAAADDFSAIGLVRGKAPPRTAPSADVAKARIPRGRPRRNTDTVLQPVLDTRRSPCRSRPESSGGLRHARRPPCRACVSVKLDAFCRGRAVRGRLALWPPPNNDAL